nr:tetratricopeptide repeat protein [Deltaproteobacteria bacterium]
RSDQFSFCVSLFEAIYGTRPFVGRSRVALVRQIRAGRTVLPPRDSKVPVKLHEVLLRGLAAKPEGRWPSMNALLDELRRQVAPRRRGPLTLGLGLAGGLGVVGIGLAYQAEVGQRCAGAAEKLAGIWDDEGRRAVADAVLGTGVSYAADTLERVEPRLEAYAQEWVAKHTDVCEATAVRQEQAERVLSLRMSCLRQRRAALRAAVNVLSNADATAVANAVQIATGLPRLSRCDDVEALRAAVPPPDDPEVRADVEQLRERLQDARSSLSAGDYVASEATTDQIVDEAQTLGYEPLLAEALLQRGEARMRAGHYERAESDLVLAYRLALRHAYGEVELTAATTLMTLVGNYQARFEDAQRWQEEAWERTHRPELGSQHRAKVLHGLGRVLVRRGELGPAQEHYERALAELQDGSKEIDRAGVLSSLGELALQRGHYDAARDRFERALATFEEWLGPRHPLVAGSLGNIGKVLRQQGRHEEALTYLQRSLALFEAAVGPRHPSIANSSTNIGNVLASQERFEEAAVYFERAVSIDEEVLGPDHPDLAVSLSNLANVSELRGDLDRALQLHERALPIKEAALGSRHPAVAFTLENLGGLLARRGDASAAQAHHERALAIWEQALGPRHPEVATSLHSLGIALKLQGDLDGARTHFERSLAIRERAQGPNHPEVALHLHGLASVMELQGDRIQARELYSRALRIREAQGPQLSTMVPPLVGLARLAMAEGDLDLAREHAERAVDIGTSAQGFIEHSAEANFVLARALWPEPAQRSRARALAERAQTIYGQVGAGAVGPRAEIERWLAQHAED